MYKATFKEPWNCSTIKYCSCNLLPWEQSMSNTLQRIWEQLRKHRLIKSYYSCRKINEPNEKHRLGNLIDFFSFFSFPNRKVMPDSSIRMFWKKVSEYKPDNIKHWNFPKSFKEIPYQRSLQKLSWEIWGKVLL